MFVLSHLPLWWNMNTLILCHFRVLTIKCQTYSSFCTNWIGLKPLTQTLLSIFFLCFLREHVMSTKVCISTCKWYRSSRPETGKRLGEYTNITRTRSSIRMKSETVITGNSEKLIFMKNKFKIKLEKNKRKKETIWKKRNATLARFRIRTFSSRSGRLTIGIDQAITVCFE